MKGKRYTTEQKIRILREAESSDNKKASLHLVLVVDFRRLPDEATILDQPET